MPRRKERARHVEGRGQRLALQSCSGCRLCAELSVWEDVQGGIAADERAPLAGGRRPGLPGQLPGERVVA
jgi:hypothetical protein